MGSMRDPLIYYEIVAGIIPLLYLALLFQANLLEDSPMFRSQTERSHRSRVQRLLEPRFPGLYSLIADDLAAVFFPVYLLVITGTGEYICLRALYVGAPPSHSTRPVVAMSLFASGLTLTYQQLMLAIGKRQEARGVADDDPSFRRYGRACYFLVLAVGFIAIAA
jgi:hypothetical protein